MAVLVLGGYGLIGSAIVQRLQSDGAAVIGLGRDTRAATRRWPEVEWRTADLARLKRPEDWAPLLAGVTAVVNAAGVLQQGLRDDVDAVQYEAMRALYAAAGLAGVLQLVQISAVGASADAGTAFLRSKGRADAALARSGLAYAVLRPGLVIGPGAYGGTSLLRGLAAIPWITPLILADSPVQTVGVGDVVEAVVRLLAGEARSGLAHDLVETQARTLRETVQLVRQWRGAPPARILPLPSAVGRVVSGLADALGWLGWRSPLRSTALRVMADGVVGDPGGAMALLGRPAQSLPQTLAALPCTPQERWFGRLWLAKPVIIATLSAFWAASGLIGLTRAAAAAAILTQRGVPESFAAGAVVAGSLIDLGLGLAVMLRPIAGLAMKGMIAVSFAYMAGAAVVTPDLWLDPLGPMAKVAPAVVLALVGLAVLEER